MKTLRFNFTKGINAVTDRRLVADGFVVLADNVDLRSGSARCIRMPERHIAAPAGTISAFYNRGQWRFASKYRTYASEFQGEQERIYYSEDGPGHSVSMKIVNGTSAQLGTRVPYSPPAVSVTGSLTPGNIQASVAIGVGNLIEGQYSYQVAAVINGAIMTPAQPVTVSIPAIPQQYVDGPFGSRVPVTTPNQSAQITLTWSAVEDATDYVIFGRTPGDEQFLFRPGMVLTWLDNGQYSPGGDFASNYENKYPLTYLYTYVRDVNGMVDEGGPSSPSPTVSSSQGKVVTRMVESDGFFNEATISTSWTTAASSRYATLGGILKKGSRTFLTIDAIPDIENATAIVKDRTYTILTLGTTNFVTSFGAVSNTVGITFQASANGVAGSGTGTVCQGVWQPQMGLRFYTASSSFVFPDKEDITFVYPLPLGEPMNATAVVSGASTLGAGAYQYRVTALRGQLTGLQNSVIPPETAPCDAVSITITANQGVYVNWSQSLDADGYKIYRSADAGSTWSLVAIKAGLGTGYTDDGTTVGSAALPTVDTGTGFRILCLMNEDLPATVTDATTYPLVYLSRTDFTTSTASGLFDQDVVYITDATQPILNGTSRANVTGATTFWSPRFTTSTDAGTLVAYPHNAYYTAWRLYRAGDSGAEFLLVAELPIDQTEYTDLVGVTALGATIGSAYTDESGMTILYEPPTADMFCPTLYNGMLAMIQGNSVKWSPIGQPDAFPESYSQSFAFPPMALASFAGGLIIFCPDGLYRLDGQTPGNVGIHHTKADGCIAPNSVQQIGNLLVYLGARGIMAFDGYKADCLTEMTIPYNMVASPSAYPTGHAKQNFWWQTTENSSQYGAILWGGSNEIAPKDSFGQVTARDRVIPGPIKAARSFVWQNKYFLYFADGIEPNNYEANTGWCVDMSMPGNPVTTFGMKAADVCVSETGDAYALLKTYSVTAGSPSVTTDVTELSLAAFTGAQSEFESPTYTTGAVGAPHVYKFNPVYGNKVPMRMRSPEITADAPHDRKRWRFVQVHGDGNCVLRTYIDGSLLTLANGLQEIHLDCAETPAHVRRIMLPPGTWGYSLAFEIAGEIDLRLIEIGFDPMPKGD